jgi:hypothetical protein
MGFTPTFAEGSGSSYSNQYILDAVGVIAIGYHSDDNFDKMRFVGKRSYSEINLTMQQGKPIIYTDQGKFYHINALVEHNAKDWTKEYGAVHLGNHIPKVTPGIFVDSEELIKFDKAYKTKVKFPQMVGRGKRPDVENVQPCKSFRDHFIR